LPTPSTDQQRTKGSEDGIQQTHHDQQPAASHPADHRDLHTDEHRQEHPEQVAGPP
jgi:hypothetical protein